MAVVSEYRVILYSAAKFSVVRQLETCSNPQGTFALAPISPAWVLAYPALPSGTLRIQSAEFPEAVSVAAHQSALALLSTDVAGTVVASASEAGTVVKVWQTRDGTLIHELRRGVHPTQISCMSFRDDSRYLAVASASPTVHVFKLDGSKEGEKEADVDDIYSRAGLSGLAGSAISAITANAPEVINGAVTTVVKSMQASRSGAVFRIPDVDAVGKPSVDLRDPSSAGSALVGPRSRLALGICRIASSSFITADSCTKPHSMKRRRSFNSANLRARRRGSALAGTFICIPSSRRPPRGMNGSCCRALQTDCL